MKITNSPKFNHVVNEQAFTDRYHDKSNQIESSTGVSAFNQTYICHNLYFVANVTQNRGLRILFKILQRNQSWQKHVAR